MTQGEARSVGRTAPLAFGALLRRHRKSAELTQEELAERANLSRRSISDMERGVLHRPRKDTIDFLAAALELSVEDHGLLVQAARRLPHQSPAVLSAEPEQPHRTPEAPALVGRSQELAALERFLAGDGPPILFLAGEPGIGKSRLLQEAEWRARAGGWTVLPGGCHRRDAQEPYAPILAALQHYTRHVTEDRLRRDLQGCAWLTRLLPELADGPAPPLPPWIVPPEQEYRLMVEAAIRFLGNIAGPSGTLLALDDLQWAGPDALDLLARVSRASFGPPLRILGAYRESEVPPDEALGLTVADLSAQRLATRCLLSPLSNDEAAQLLDQIVESEVGAPLREQLIRRAGGVPFFVLSCGQTLQSGGDEAGRVPWDVEQSVRQRVGALPLSARHMLGVAAIVGRVAQSALLFQASAQPEEKMLDALDVTCRARLLEETEDGSYRFTHDVIREVVEADLGSARRRVLHRRVAEALEQNPGTPSPLLAHHYSRGDDISKAARYLEQAGDETSRQYAHASAARYYGELLGVLDAAGRAQERARACEKLAGALLRTACYGEALSSLERAMETYRLLGGAEGERRCLAQIGWVHAIRGTPSEGIARILPLIERLDLGVPSPGLGGIHVALCQLYGTSTQYELALAAAERAVDIARALGDDRELGAALATWSDQLVMAEYVDEAIGVAEEAADIADRVGDLLTLCTAYRALIGAHENSGDMVKALAAGNRAVEVAKQLDDPTVVALARASRAEVTFTTGQWDLTREDLEAALRLVREIGSGDATNYVLLLSSRYCLHTGEWDEAAQRLEECVSAGGHHGPWAQGTLAELDLLSGRPDRARDRLAPFYAEGDSTRRRSIRVSTPRPILALAYLELGELEKAEALVAMHAAWATERGFTFALVEALSVGGTLAARQEHWEDAERNFGEATALTHDLPFPYAEARTMHEWGRMHVSKSEMRPARERLEAALAIFQRLGAKKDVEQVAGELSTIAG